MIEQIFDQITNLQGGVGIVAIFLVLLLCGVGLPLPEDIPLIAAGYFVYLGETNIWTAALLCVIGVLAGDTVIFYTGKTIGKKVFKSRFISSIVSADKISRVAAYYRKWGRKIIFFGRFIAGLRAPIFFFAGMSKVSYSRFLLLDGLAALISVPLWILLGRHFGEDIEGLLNYIHKFKPIFTGIIFGIIGLLLIMYYRKSKKTASVVRITRPEKSKN